MPRGALHPMKPATVIPGRGRDVQGPGSNGGRVVRAVERPAPRGHLLVAARLVPAFPKPGAEAPAPTSALAARRARECVAISRGPRRAITTALLAPRRRPWTAPSTRTASRRRGREGQHFHQRRQRRIRPLQLQRVDVGARRGIDPDRQATQVARLGSLAPAQTSVFFILILVFY